MSRSVDASTIARAYDALAGSYDQKLENDRWMRHVLWRHFDGLFRAGDRVLDVGCGTGIDTLHLVSRGVQVTAIDASAGMITRLREKLGDGSRDNAPLCLVGDTNAVLSQLSGSFDGLVSSFAALNTIDLDRFSESAARLVEPGGRIVCHMLSPGFHGGHRLSRWLHGSGSGGPEYVSMRLSDQTVELLNLGPRDVYQRFFATRFEQRACYALGVAVTPGLERRLPLGVLELLGRADALLGSLRSLQGLGRFFVLDLQRRP